MLHRFHDRFGTAGVVISVIVLVAALGGTALAKGLFSKAQEKKIAAIAKKYAGKPGAPGATGPAGANGTNGANGAKGDQGIQGIPGAPGTNGKTVLNGSGLPTAGIGTVGDFYIMTSTDEIFGPKAASGANGGWGNGTELVGETGKSVEAESASGAECEEGGTKFEVEGSGAAEHVCNGSPWVAGKAPTGAVLKGSWAIHTTAGVAEERIPIAVSFGVPAGVSEFADIVPAGGPDPFATFFGEPVCTGSFEHPTPPASASGPLLGIVCLYAKGSMTDFKGWEVSTDVFTGEGVDPVEDGGLVVMPRAAAAGMVAETGSWAVSAE